MLLHDCPKFGQLFMMSKTGYFYMYEISTCAQLARQQLTNFLPVVACRNPVTDGMVFIDKGGVVHSVNVEGTKLVQYVCKSLNSELGINLAKRFGLTGVDDIFTSQFN